MAQTMSKTERHRPEKRKESGLCVLDYVVVKRHHTDPEVRRLVYGVLGPKFGCDAVHLRLRLLEGNSWLQPTEDREKRVVSRRHLAVIDLERDPDVGMFEHESLSGEEESKSIWQNPDHRMVDVVNLDGATHQLGIASEPTLPETVADHCDLRTVGNFFPRLEVPPKHRVDTEEGKEVCANG